MKFKARIERVHGGMKGFTDTGQGNPFVFSRSKIFFTKHHKNETYFLGIMKSDPIQETGVFRNGSHYTFDKAYDSDDKKRFVMIIPYDSMKANLTLNWYNRIKCNWVHKRYFIQREKDWFIKTVITALIGFLMGLIGLYAGYRLGIQSSPKPSQQPIQLPTR